MPLTLGLSSLLNDFKSLHSDLGKRFVSLIILSAISIAVVNMFLIPSDSLLTIPASMISMAHST